MTPEQMMEKIQVFIGGYNSFDVETMMSVLDPEIVFLNTAGGVTNVDIRGAEDFRKLAEQSLPVFSTRCQTVAAHKEINNGLEITIDYQAVPAVDLPGGIKAGEKLAFQGRSVYLFKDGLISFIEDIV